MPSEFEFKSFFVDLSSFPIYSENGATAKIWGLHNSSNEEKHKAQKQIKKELNLIL